MTTAEQLEVHRQALVGFSFNPRFTDEKAACMVVSDVGWVMLLQDAFYRTFTKRDLCDTTRQNEGLVALSCESRAEVDALVRTAVEAGGSQAMEPMDHGFMYERSFHDPDGHHWAVLWMDPKVARGEAPARSAEAREEAHAATVEPSNAAAC